MNIIIALQWQNGDYYQKMSMIVDKLTEAELAIAVEILCQQDEDLAAVYREFGQPPLWAREPGFATLIHIILEQQVSLASAKAAFDKLLQLAAPLTPMRLLELDDAELKAAGFSRQKTAYARNLAQAIVNGQFNVARLEQLDDFAVRNELVKLKGIGNWTADIYLLMALGRPDIWPKGDLALAVAAQAVKRLSTRPTPDELEVLGNHWKPWRAAAARLLWHYYLSKRR